MKTIQFLISTIAAGLLLTGCGKQEPRPLAETSAEDAPPLHKKGEGILLCELTKESIGLKTIDVASHKADGKDALVVPSSAVLNTAEGTFLFVVNGDHYKRTPVKVGDTFGSLVEITDGIYEGDAVVAEAAQTLWLIELRAVKGGKGCCPIPEKKT
jgi:hypothetical protein